MKGRIKKEAAIQLDRQDELRKFREEFYVQESQIYLDGNSLGLLSKRAEKATLDLLSSWKNYGIDGWTEGEHPWFTFSEALGEKTAPLIGAAKEEVIVTGSITSNLHQMIASFYKPDKTKNKILADELNFPSDIYAIQSQLELKGYDPASHLKKIPSLNGQTLDLDQIKKSITDDTAMILLPSVLYRSGQLLPIKEIVEYAHTKSVIVGFDLAHSIGAVPHQLHEWGVDFAVWCNYKYMNSGPGGTGGLFVHKKHHGKIPGLKGWFGSQKEKQFDMEHTFSPADDAGAYQIGTPHILSSAPLLGSLSLFEEAGMNGLREKSLKQTDFMLQLIEDYLLPYGFKVVTPLVHSERGGHIALEHPEAASICKALKNQRVIPDFRAPNLIRFAPAPFYTSYEELFDAIHILQEVMEKKLYQLYKNTRNVIA
ncbi:kynureninase [Jeotgalibacillus proteolyticus]|uniref:Kynureninase n=1 Tax=Jeotgalibacillus proteolyticus TaxID=2082395 RepID=A0A2S5GHA7_9BACL|nr:kynureninase [Jeotgalibacillus proteolyticus]PPA72437.1 kynureninase [Jeotgalibacillus proteolyticus]